MSFLSFDQYAMHIGWKTTEAKKRQREGIARGVATRAAVKRGEEPVKKQKASRNKAVKRQEYVDTLPFLTAQVVENSELRNQIEAEGPPLVFPSNTRIKAISLDVGVRNLCGWAIQYVDPNVPIQHLPPHDYTPNPPNVHFQGVQNCIDFQFVQQSGTISTKSVYQEAGIQSRNHRRQRLFEEYQNLSDEFLDECEDLQSNSMKTNSYEKLVLGGKLRQKCLINFHGRLYSSKEASKTKFLNRVRMKQYFRKLFKSFIVRRNPIDNTILEDPNYVFIGGTDTFGKGLSKKMIKAIELLNKENGKENNINSVDSKKRIQLNPANEFRTSVVCP